MPDKSPACFSFGHVAGLAISTAATPAATHCLVTVVTHLVKARGKGGIVKRSLAMVL